jgi:ABC-type ATPase with predicted acetyltransferase domain
MREVVTRAKLGPGSLRVCLALGLCVRRPKGHILPERLSRAADEIIDRLDTRRPAHGTVVFITGPSGGGKSTLLRELARRLAVPVASAPRYSVKALADRADPASLARAGLAEGEAMVRRSDELSEGQRHRFAVALAMDGAGPSRPVLIDEFGSTLDRLTACSLARASARWARAEGFALLAASAHDDLTPWLAPDLTVHVPLTGEVTLNQ